MDGSPGLSDPRRSSDGRPLWNPRVGLDSYYMEVVAPKDADARAAELLRNAFERLGNPMMLVDDRRWCVTANAPACGLLSMVPEAVPWYRIDDFTPVNDQARIDEVWEAFLANGAMEGWYQLPLATGGVLPIEFSATANVLPGRHLSVIVPRAPATRPGATQNGHSTRNGSPLWESRIDDVTAARRGEWVRIVPPDSAQAPLTNREREVLGLIAGGLQGGGIADRLVLSTATIKSHAQNAMMKLGAHTRAHAVAIALSTGQIDLQGVSRVADSVE